MTARPRDKKCFVCKEPCYGYKCKDCQKKKGSSLSKRYRNARTYKKRKTN